MAHKVTGRAHALLHTVVPVEPFRAHLGAPRAHPAGLTDAGTIVLATFGVVVAVAPLAAVLAVEHVLAHRLAQCSGPAGWTLALARHVRTFATVLAAALLLAVLSEESGRAGMLTRRTDVPWWATVLARDVIAHPVLIWTFFQASMAEGAGRAGFVAGRSSPTAGTDTVAGGRIARRVVMAGTDFLAILTVVAKRAPTFAANSCKREECEAREVTMQIVRARIAPLPDVIRDPTGPATAVADD